MKMKIYDSYVDAAADPIRNLPFNSPHRVGVIRRTSPTSENFATNVTLGS